jgi:hypothetical protein
MEGCGLDLFNSRYRPLSDCCEFGSNFESHNMREGWPAEELLASQ